MMGVSVAVALVALVFYASILVPSSCKAAYTSRYMRQLAESVDMPLDSEAFRVPPGYNAPQQVHIHQGDQEGKAVIVSWITPSEPGSNTVLYWKANTTNKYKAEGIVTSYKFINYTSGHIHHCTIKDLEHDTTYYYEVGIGGTPRQFFFTTPPAIGPDVPYTFGVIGDLGQTYDSNETFHHYHLNPKKGQAVLFVGDLSYADKYPFHDNNRWDTWGRFVEKSMAYQPWIVTTGNHDIDFLPDYGETVPFKPYTHRFHVPYKAAGSTSPLWYSIKRASTHIIVLSSYSGVGKYTPQYIWLNEEFSKVDRKKTPWLIVVMHTPWYNTYNYHYMEGEYMRVVYEPWFVKYKVDIVFVGHVHAYERSERISNIAYNISNKDCYPVKNQYAPVYITIGDGGNVEGLPTYPYGPIEPQPDYSVFRESSYGHAILEIKNRTHAYYNWYRNHEGAAVVGDTHWFYNRYWYPVEEPKIHPMD